MKIHKLVAISFKLRCANQESDISTLRPLLEQKTPCRLCSLRASTTLTYFYLFNSNLDERMVYTYIQVCEGDAMVREVKGWRGKPIGRFVMDLCVKVM